MVNKTKHTFPQESVYGSKIRFIGCFSVDGLSAVSSL